MQSEAPLPSPSEIWGVLPPRFAEELKSNAADIWRLSGLEDEYGPPSVGFTREREIHEMIDEITAIIMTGIALDMEARQSASRTGRGAGRPRDVLSRHLGPALLEMFLRCHDSAGRKSVLTSIDGKFAQGRTVIRVHETRDRACEPLFGNRSAPYAALSGVASS